MTSYEILRYPTISFWGVVPVCPRCNWSPATYSAWTIESL